MTVRVLDMLAADTAFLSDLAQMDGLHTTVTEGQTFVAALHRHQPGLPEQILLQRPSDIDVVLDDARRCLFADCAGRVRVQQIDAARLAEIAQVRRVLGVQGA